MSQTKPTAKTTNIAAAQGVLRSVDAEERIAWVSRALCRTTDPDELFVRGAAQRKAAVICRHCPVMQECGADALDNKVEFGVWGGMTERSVGPCSMNTQGACPGRVSWTSERPAPSAKSAELHARLCRPGRACRASAAIARRLERRYLEILPIQ